nr:serine/threonine-protein kinase prp4 [Quercus suber]
MSGRSPSLSDGEIPSEDEEKVAIARTTTMSHRITNVDPLTRPKSSSRFPQPSGSRKYRDPYYRWRNDDGLVNVSLLPTEETERYHREGDMYSLEQERSISLRRKTKARSRSRSRSPWRADRGVAGAKRKHNDLSKHSGDDPRSFKVVREYGPSASRRGRDQSGLYETSRVDGLSKHGDFYSGHSYERRRRTPSPARGLDRSRSPYRRRSRSRSPFHHDKLRRLGNPHSGVQHSEGQRSVNPPKLISDIDTRTRCSRRGSTPSSSRDVQSHHSLQSSHPLSSSSDPRTTMGSATKALEQDHEHDQAQLKLTEEEVIEQRRKRRQALRAKHTTQPDLLVKALEQNILSAPTTPAEHDSPPTTNSPGTPRRDSPPESPAAFSVDDVRKLANHHHHEGGDSTGDEGPSAADYDPNMDMGEDRPDHKKLTIPESQTAPILASEVQAHVDSTHKQNDEFDMFAEEIEDDMFAPTNLTSEQTIDTKEAKTLDQSLLDNWDYPDGHYRIILNELLDGRYAVQQQIGKGTFATVVRAMDAKTGNAVAIKIACNNDTMYKAGQKETDILQVLNAEDVDDKKHIIRLQRSFVHKAHLCLVFENMNADLREVLKKFGRNVGISPQAIRSYAQQMFLALAHMKKCEIIHADLKPDNILISDKLSVLKVCDLGTATTVTEAEITPYLVSRFYRAPEVILGMEIGYPIDMWSIGCTLFELYTGRILFAGTDNNQMLRIIQECRGKIPMRMLKLSQLAAEHFDQEGIFISQERDKITGKVSSHRIPGMKSAAVSGKELKTRLGGNVHGLSPTEKKEHEAFVDLMEKCLQLDPNRRITPNDALRHHFIAHQKMVTSTTKAKVVPAMGVAWKR